jgi:group I intron endonuclease
MQFKEAEYLIYLLYNTLTSEFYIGKTCLLNKRLSQHRTLAKKPKIYWKSKLHTAISQYGAEVFVFAVIESGLSEGLAYNRELEYIVKLNPSYNVKVINWATKPLT